MKPIETEFTRHRYLDQCCVTSNSLRAGIVLWGTAGAKMPTMRVPAFRCGTDWLGWLFGTDPAMEDGKVHRTVCFSNFNNGCKYSESIKERIKKKQNKTKQKNRKRKEKNGNSGILDKQITMHLARPLTK